MQQRNCQMLLLYAPIMMISAALPCDLPCCAVLCCALQSIMGRDFSDEELSELIRVYKVRFILF